MLMDQDTQWLYQLLAEVQLDKFYLRVRDDLNITRIEHFAYVKESDLETVGISKPGEPGSVTLIHSSTHSSIHSVTHSFSQSLVHSFMHSSSYSLIHSFLH